MENYGIDNSGFTLIELVMVLGIITILSGVGVFAFQGMYANYKLKGASRQLFSDMQYARLNAIKGGKEWIVDFEADGSYVVRPNVMGDKDRGKPANIPHQFKGVKICNFIDSADPLEDVEFNPNGPASSRSYKVSLHDYGRVYKVYVSSPGTGNIRIMNLNKDDPEDAVRCP